ncbi:hypothetical protein ABGV42_00585 [Paenibacillus pabuli]|uniref:hypothetical protein n=1 Tax=Paenibacillus pabuli TaxID=1472 RepID=UPI003242D685
MSAINYTYPDVMDYSLDNTANYNYTFNYMAIAKFISEVRMITNPYEYAMCSFKLFRLLKDCAGHDRIYETNAEYIGKLETQYVNINNYLSGLEQMDTEYKHRSESIIMELDAFLRQIYNINPLVLG